MKTILKTTILLILAVGFQSAKGQTVSDVENISIPSGSYGGTAVSGDSSFASGNALFTNNYSGYWAKGWVYSNVKDSTTAGYTNLAGARAGSGYGQSDNYVVGQQNSSIKLTGSAVGKQVNGMYVCNGTYAALSMRNGDSFAKKFGGVSGDDPDYFLLTVKGYKVGIENSDSVNFYLADFRNSDNSKDYIITNWTWVDLSTLGNVDSLVFKLSSSDVGSFGMNTPSFFCVDNFTTADSPASSLIAKQNYAVNVFPNPTSGRITVQTNEFLGGTLQVLSLSGQVFLNQTINSEVTLLNMDNLQAGLYLLNLENDEKTSQTKIIKK